MSRNRRYDHIIGDEFDDYEHRRQCVSCRSRETPLVHGSPTGTGEIRAQNNGTTVRHHLVLFTLIAAILATGILLYGSDYFRTSADKTVPPTTCPGRSQTRAPSTTWFGLPYRNRRLGRRGCRKCPGRTRDDL